MVRHGERARNLHARGTARLHAGHSLPFQRCFLLSRALHWRDFAVPLATAVHLQRRSYGHMKSDPSIDKGHGSVLSRKPYGRKIGPGATVIWGMSIQD
jgi:hypothetical protein